MLFKLLLYFSCHRRRLNLIFIHYSLTVSNTNRFVQIVVFTGLRMLLIFLSIRLFGSSALISSFTLLLRTISLQIINSISSKAK